MKYKVSMRVSGAHSTFESRTKEIYIIERSAESDTIGGVFDALVELAYEVHEDVSAWVKKTPLKTGLWYISSSWPDPNNPKATPESNLGGGGQVSPDEEIVMRAISIRDLEIRRALRKKGRESKTDFVYELNAEDEIYSIIENDIPLEEWRNYGLKGSDLEESS